MKNKEKKFARLLARLLRAHGYKPNSVSNLVIERGSAAVNINAFRHPLKVSRCSS